MAAYNPHTKRESTGCLRKAAMVFVAATIAGGVICLFLVFVPQRLDGVGGLAEVDGGRDVSAVLRESQQRQVPVTLTEEEINQWLARTLEVRQGGKFEDSVEFKRVVVRLSKGLAEVVLVREIGGRPFTVSMFLSIHQEREGNLLRTEMNRHGGGYFSGLPGPPRGGRFGRVTVPQGFLRLVMPSYEALTEALAEELDTGFRNMTHITIEDKMIQLDPRVPRREEGGARPE